MVKYFLKASAELDNVTDLQPIDTTENPFEYTFHIQCTSCRQVHGKPVTINRFEKHEMDGSRGEASFVFRCRDCKGEHSASITRTKETVTIEKAGKFVPILEIDARGVEFVEFIPDGQFECRGAETTTRFDDVDLSDGEWYDYDEKANAEVSITDVKWEVARS